MILFLKSSKLTTRWNFINSQKEKTAFLESFNLFLADEHYQLALLGWFNALPPKHSCLTTTRIENFKEGRKFQNSKTSISPVDEMCLYTEVKIQLLGGGLEKGFKPKLARWSTLVKFYTLLCGWLEQYFML